MKKTFKIPEPLLRGNLDSSDIPKWFPFRRKLVQSSTRILIVRYKDVCDTDTVHGIPTTYSGKYKTENRAYLILKERC